MRVLDRPKLTLFARGPLAETCLTILNVEDLSHLYGCAGVSYMVRTECCGSIYELTHKEVSRKLQKSRQARKDGRPIPVCNRCKHRVKNGREQPEPANDFHITPPDWPVPPLALAIVRQHLWWPR